MACSDIVLLLLEIHVGYYLFILSHIGQTHNRDTRNKKPSCR